uniref:Protein YIP n=1 Tax=Wollemia nobilis TaxID=56998 RepID=A0A0C9RRP6_9CONI
MMSSGYTHLENQNVSGSVPAASGPDQVQLKFSETNLQTFPPPSETQGKITGAHRPPSDADDSFSRPGPGGQEDNQQPSGWQRFFGVASYQPYFNVDTIDVLERIRDSLLPYKGSFSEKTINNPDLYGPFWICTTLIFVAAALGNVVAYIAHKTHHKHWNYDINQVTWSACLFYGYVGVVPLVVYFVLKYLSVPSGLVQLWCLYGYSLFVFIPASCLSVVPLEIFRWVVVAAAGLLSATFLAINLRSHIKTASDRWFLIVAGIFLLQLGLAVILKLYFFTIVLGKD